jgi:hypothetical protein
MSGLLVFDLTWMLSEGAQTVVFPTCLRVAWSAAAFWSEPHAASYPPRWRGLRNPFRNLPTREELISQKQAMSKIELQVRLRMLVPKIPQRTREASPLRAATGLFFVWNMGAGGN